MIIRTYQNRRNENKYIEVHNDGHYHNTVRQFMFLEKFGVENLLGDRKLHRWRIGNLRVLLEDYRLVGEEIKLRKGK